MLGISFVRESNVYDKNEYTLDAQEEANAANAARDGVTINYTFREKFSGVDLWSMPKLTELRAVLQSQPGRKVIYVYAQDRLVRGEQAEDIFWLLVEFRRYDAEVRFHVNPLDLSTIAGKIQMLIAGHEASGEIRKILDRTWTRGRLRRMKEGKIHNAGPNKYGFRRIKETGKAVIVEEEAFIIRRIATLIEEGHGLATVARQLDAEHVRAPGGKRWSATTIRSFFTDLAYKGEGYGWRWSKPKLGRLKSRPIEDQIKLAPDAYPPIIEPARWDRLHQKIQENRGMKARNRKRFYLLRGLVFCAKCGAPCYPLRGGRDQAFRYRCGATDRARRRQGEPCKAKASLVTELEIDVWAAILELVQNPAELTELLRAQWPVQDHQAQADVRALRSAAAAKTAEVARLAARLRTASDLIAAHIEAEMTAAESERRALDRQIAELEGQTQAVQARSNQISDLLVFVEREQRLIASYPPEDRRKLLEQLNLGVSAEGGKWEFKPLR